MKRFVLLAVLPLGVLAACSDDDGGSAATTVEAPASSTSIEMAPGDVLEAPSTVAVPDTPLCNAAADILAIETQVEPAVGDAIQRGLADGSTQPIVDAVRALQEDGTAEQLLAAYDELTDVVPADKAQDVQTVRAFTKDFFDDIVALPNVAEVQAFVQSRAGSTEGQAAVAATTSLDAVIEEECGFSIAA